MMENVSKGRFKYHNKLSLVELPLRFSDTEAPLLLLFQAVTFCPCDTLPPLKMSQKQNWENKLITHLLCPKDQYQ